MMHGQQNVKF